MAFYTTTNRRLNQVMASSRNASYAVGLITGLVLVLMLFLAVLPAYRSISDQIQNNKAKQQYLDQLNAKKETMDKLLLEYEANKPLIEQFEKTFYGRNNNELMTANLDNLAAISSVQFSTITYDKVEAPKTEGLSSYSNLRVQKIDMVFKGKMLNLLDMMKAIQSFPTYIEIDSVVLNYDSNRNNLGITTSGQPLSSNPDFQLTVNGWYYFWQK